MRNEDRDAYMLENPSLLIEPVRVTVTWKTAQTPRVFPLDHDGRKAPDAVAIPVRRTDAGVQFTLDGAMSKAVYYVVETPPRHRW